MEPRICLQCSSLFSLKGRTKAARPAFNAAAGLALFIVRTEVDNRVKCRKGQEMCLLSDGSGCTGPLEFCPRVARS